MLDAQGFLRCLSWIDKHNGHLILLTDRWEWITAEPLENGWQVCGPCFKSVDEARRFIDLTAEERHYWLKAGKPSLASDLSDEQWWALNRSEPWPF